jgi:hypothetical protein
MPTLPPNAALVLPTIKEAIREQERLHAVWLQDEVTELNTKMVKEIEAIIKAHKDMSEFIKHPVTLTELSLTELPHLNHGDEDYEIDN